MIKAFIFDLGGVVVKWSDDIVWERIAERFHIDYSSIKKKLDYLVTLRELGSIGEKKMWETFFNFIDTPLPKDYRSFMSNEFEKRAALNARVIKLIKKLKYKGYKTGVISNIESSHERIVSKKRWLKCFDVAVLSYKVGVRKPSREIYKIALKSLKVKPEEAIFIDNLKENVIGAKKVGIKSLLFKDAVQLEKELKKYL